MSTVSNTPRPDLERHVRSPRQIRLLRRPEFGALLGAAVIFVLFTVVDTTGQFATLGGAASWTDFAAPVGIVALPVALLMIAGEFDLSAGVMVGTAGLTAGLLMTQLGWPIWPSILAAMVLAALIGFVNGLLVVKTSISSFIVTLATFFVLKGANLALTKLLTGSVRVSGINDGAGFATAHGFFASTFEISGATFQVSLAWWIVLLIVAAVLLNRTVFGNWIFAVGGDANAARRAGAPVPPTKILLFMLTSVSSALVGMMFLLRLHGMQAGQGVGQEFFYIIAAAVGGCLLTGGAGSVVGAAIGALIMGFAAVGIPYALWNQDWVATFLGMILFAAVFINISIANRVRHGPSLPRHRLASPGKTSLDHPGVAVPHNTLRARAATGTPECAYRDAGNAAIAASTYAPALALRDVDKMFGNVTALRGINLRIDRGMVTGILGDNGAGKSTLIKILSGVHQPTRGKLMVDGEPVTFASPRDAHAHGIATVFQDLATIPLMSVWRNFFLGNEPVRGWAPLGMLAVRHARQVCKRALAEMGIDLTDVEQPIGTLSGGERQAVAIARAVHFGAKVLILDEPTSALGVLQSGKVLKYILATRAMGVAVVFITHNPHHAFMVGDRFYLLSRGELCADFMRDTVRIDDLVQAMAGGAELESLAHEISVVRE